MAGVGAPVRLCQCLGVSLAQAAECHALARPDLGSTRDQHGAAGGPSCSLQASRAPARARQGQDKAPARARQGQDKAPARARLVCSSSCWPTQGVPRSERSSRCRAHSSSFHAQAEVFRSAPQEQHRRAPAEGEQEQHRHAPAEEPRAQGVRARYRREYLELLSNRNATSSPLPELARMAGQGLRAPRDSHCPTYVMLPLDTVAVDNTLSLPRALQAGLLALRSVGVDGVMVDVWWGIVEAQGPRRYDWSAYAALIRMVHAAGLKMQAVMSFHGCGGNVGDTCHVALPHWVLRHAEGNPDVLYTDRGGRRNSEYLSLGVDRLALFEGRTPLDMYQDFIRSFRDTFSEHMGSTIVEVAVGLGPAGELRYPSYPEGDGRWQYPGIGEFQCYDKYMLASLKATARAVGRPDWGLSGPHDAGTYNQSPDETGFFQQQHGSWRSEYGDFFLAWYSQSLIAHGSRVLAVACHALRDSGVLVAAKLPGIHWWHRSLSRPAELTAGYYNTGLRCGYEPVVRMLARHEALLNFTCVEMGDDEQPWHAHSSPEALLMQVRECCARYGVHMSGENALPRFDATAHQRIRRNAYLPDRPDVPPLESFTFLRMGETLFQADNWHLFVEFIKSMDDVYPEDMREQYKPWRTSQPRSSTALLRPAVSR